MLVAGQVDGDDHAGRDACRRCRRGLADLRVLEQLGQLADPRLLLALLLLGGVVAAVLAQVALLAGRLDLA